MKVIVSFERGFTLLEVMIALAITSIALVVLLSLGNRSILVNERLQRTTQGTLLAQSVITELETGASELVADTLGEEGTFEAPFENYRWTTAYEDVPMLSGVKLVRVTVLWGEEKRNEKVELTSFLVN